MVDFKKYHERLQNKIGEAMAADKILEGHWWDVVIKDLNLMSYYFAMELVADKRISRQGYVQTVLRGVASNASYVSDSDT